MNTIPARTLVLLSALVLVTLAACGDGDQAGDGDATTTAPPTTDQDGGVDDTTTTTAQGNPPAGTQVDQAVADLAGRLDVDAGAITIVAQEAVTWPDGSLGCPQPGMGYTQALVDGTRILLEVDGQTYSYHAAGTDVPFLCEDPKPGVGET